MTSDCQPNPNIQKLEQEKAEARQKLLLLPPLEAQKQVEQVLHANLWTFEIENHSWEESIPTHYGETDT